MIGLIIGLYGAKANMPAPLFYFSLIFLVVCLVILFLILMFYIVRFLLGWNRSFQFGDKWYCQYNQKSKHIELHGNVYLNLSSFSKMEELLYKMESPIG